MPRQDDHLRYFQTVRLTDNHKESAADMEDILQKEHLPDGTHPTATEAQSGFISAQDVQRIRAMYKYLKGLGAF